MQIGAVKTDPNLAALDVAAITEAFASVRQSLTEFDSALQRRRRSCNSPHSSGDGIHART